MLTPGAEHGAEQLAAPIGDQVLLGVLRRAVDQAHDFDDFVDVVQVLTDRQTSGVQGAHEINGNPFGSLVALSRAHAESELTGVGLSIFFGDVATEVNPIALDHKGDIGCSGCCNGGQDNAKGLELCVDVVLREGVIKGGKGWVGG